MKKKAWTAATTYQAWDDIGVVNLSDVLQVVSGHRAQGFLRPLGEPVDGAAVDETRELPKPGAEDLTNGAGLGGGVRGWGYGESGTAEVDK